jgi:hypothetical protein
MEKVRMRVKALVPRASFARKAWVDIVIFLLAGVLIGSGVYVRSQREWTLSTDIGQYNRGVSAYQELLWAPLVSSEESLLSVYPHVIEKAGESFDKASSESRDQKLKSLASYNSGTLLARTAFLSQQLPDTASYIVGALSKLGEAIRNDPHNEDAKFNLELLERVLERKEVEAAGPGPGYSPGAVYKGY